MKLVGKYKVVVKSVDVGKNPKGNDVLKLGLDFMSEYQNGQWFEMSSSPNVVKHFSLKREVGSFGKSQAQMTAEVLRSAFDFKGGFNDLHQLMFAQAIAVCEEHDRGNFTSVKYLNHISDADSSKELKEFSDDVIDELEKIFALVA